MSLQEWISAAWQLDWSSLDGIAAALLECAGRQVLYSSLLFLVVLPVNTWLLHRGPRRTAALRSALWGLVLLRLVLPPDLAVPGSAGALWGRLQTVLVERPAEPAPASAAGAEAARGHTLGAGPAAPRPWVLALAAGWALGAAISWRSWLRRRRAVRRWVASGRTVTDRGVLATAERWRRRLGLARPVRVVSVETPVAPFTLGTRAPVVVLPRALLDRPALTGERWAVEAVLAHELAHVQRRDDLRLAVTQLLRSIWFFHPVVRWVAGRLAAERERLSDARVLGQGVIPPRAYGRSLLAVSRLAASSCPSGSWAAVPAFLPTQRSLTMRIREIVREGSSPSPRTAPALAAALAAGLFLLPMAPLPAASPTPVSPETSVSAKALPAWSNPLPGARVTSPYGPRKDPLGSQLQVHRGIDVAALRGTEILAPAAGTVRIATAVYEGGAHYGTVVVVDHGGGLTSFYSHLDRLDVIPGQWVSARQILGTVGMTGETTGAHLHFEVWRDGTPIDPAELVAVWRGC